MSDVLCNDCLDTGWLCDREGRTPCSCVAETEPYQLLKEENKRLSKLATQRGERMQIMREMFREIDRHHACMERPEMREWFDQTGVPTGDFNLDDQILDAPSGVGVDAVVSLPPIAVDALRRAAHEFVDEHGWSLDGEIGVPEPFQETQFFVVLAKHIGPLLDADAYKAARIEALKTELRILEG